MLTVKKISSHLISYIHLPPTGPQKNKGTVLAAHNIAEHTHTLKMAKEKTSFNLMYFRDGKFEDMSGSDNQGRRMNSLPRAMFISCPSSKQQ
jgi:hypothetical protein